MTQPISLDLPLHTHADFLDTARAVQMAPVTAQSNILAKNLGIKDIPKFKGLATQVSSTGVAASIEGKESGLMVKATNLQIIQFDEAFIDFWSGSLFDPITSKRPTFIICKFKSTLEFPYK